MISSIQSHALSFGTASSIRDAYDKKIEANEDIAISASVCADVPNIQPAQIPLKGNVGNNLDIVA